MKLRQTRMTKRSEELQSRADQVIAGGALTNSKRPQSFVQGVYPTQIKHGLGAIVTDVDGNELVDYICALGAQLVGYRHPAIESEVINQIRKGTIFSLGTELEIEVAEMLRSRFNFIQKLKFLKTGSEACSAAVKIARAFTGRSLILSEGYHGWHSEFTSLTPPAHGIPPIYSQVIVPLNKREISIATAAVIIEPVIVDQSPERIALLRNLRDQTSKNGALLIFDETITALRFPEYSVAKFYGIEPDLIIMGKALGAGYPLSLIGGRADVMSADYFVSSTFAGDCVALAAAKALLKLTYDRNIMNRFWDKGKAFCDKFNSIDKDLIRIDGYGTRGLFIGEARAKALFMQECVKAGVLFGPSFFYGLQHEFQDDFTLGVCHTVLNRIKNGQVNLEGQMPQTPFAQKARET